MRAAAISPPVIELIANTSRKYSVRQWRLRGEYPLPLKGHSFYVSDLTFEGIQVSTVDTYSDDCIIRLYSAFTGEQEDVLCSGVIAVQVMVTWVPLPFPLEYCLAAFDPFPTLAIGNTSLNFPI